VSKRGPVCDPRRSGLLTRVKVSDRHHDLVWLRIRSPDPGGSNRTMGAMITPAWAARLTANPQAWNVKKGAGRTRRPVFKAGPS
jgi:hypothetical protein